MNRSRGGHQAVNNNRVPTQTSPARSGHIPVPTSPNPADIERINRERAEEEQRRRLADQAAAEEAARIRAQRAEQERQKRIEEERRAATEAAAREKARIEQQRRENEEKARLKREALERQQAEEAQRIKAMQESLRAEKEKQLRMMAEEREKQRRLEELRREVEEQMRQNAPKPTAKKTVAPVVQKSFSRVQRKEAGGDLATFEPENSLDRAILTAYASRSAPDPSLPPVSFSKRNGNYFIGNRRINVREDGSELVVDVKPGVTLELLPFLEDAERMEGMKLRALKGAQVFINSGAGFWQI